MRTKKSFNHNIYINIIVSTNFLLPTGFFIVYAIWTTKSRFFFIKMEDAFDHNNPQYQGPQLHHDSPRYHTF